MDPIVDLRLAALGWTEERALAFTVHADAGYLPGRVVGAARDVVRARTAAAGDVSVIVQRGFRRSVTAASAYPAVGDWLALEPLPGGDVALRAVLARTSVFSRGAHDAQHASEQVLAANVDTVVIVGGLDHDLNLRRLERYLSLAWASRADPVVLLNKADLCDDVPARVAAVATISGGAPILVSTASTGEGLDALLPLLEHGRTVVLLGSSGVGKSTITNVLLGDARQAVREVREDDSRGRHTTTSRELFELRDGGLLIDTPGMRSLGLWDTEDGLDRAFADIDDVAAGCRFSDCSHEVEPGCAVLEAIDAGDLAVDRLRSRRKLQRELGLIAQRSDPAAQRAAGKRWGRMAREAARAAEWREGAAPDA